MKKHFLLLLIFIFSSFLSKAQTKGIKIGYIDMEYILENVPDYTAARNLLEEKAQKWKQEIEIKKNEITKFKEALRVERPLLTKELLEERQDEIKFIEAELLDYQQKRFGPNGDMIIQKSNLIKPIQDQVFTAVQDLAESKKYDFIFDKSSDLTLLFGARKFDISDQIVRTLERTSNRKQLSRKELKEIEKQESEEDLENDNPILAERNEIRKNKNTERERLEEEKKEAYKKRRAAYEEKKRLKKVKIKEKQSEESIKGENTTSIKQESIDPKVEERKKLLEERRQKILDAREAAKKKREAQHKEKN